MNTVNTEKRVMSKTIKNTVIALGISLASIFSISASAQTAPSIEAAVSEFVVAQSKQMMNQLNEQLKQTITNEVKALSFNLSVENIEQKISQKMANSDESSKINNEPVIAQVKLQK